MSHNGKSLMQFDVVILADMTRKGDIGLRIKQEILACFGLGYSVGLRHLPTTKSSGSVSRDIHRCVRENYATVIPFDAPVRAALAIVFSPSVLDATLDLSHLRADNVVLVQDRMPMVEQMGRWFSFAIGPMIWAPTNRWVRAALEKIGMPVTLSEMDWRPAVPQCVNSTLHRRTSRSVIVGRVSVPGKAQWPDKLEDFRETYPQSPNVEYRILGNPPTALKKEIGETRDWVFFDPEHISVERFIAGLDVFLYFPSASVPELPDAAIAMAMAQGKIVVLPPHLRPHFGECAVYADPDVALQMALQIFEDEDRLQQCRKNAIELSRIRFSSQLQEERLRSLVSIKRRRRNTTAKRESRVMFVPSNGIGLGHVTRALAVARRLPDDFTPFFVSMAQAAPIFEHFGFQSEYMPSHKEIGVSAEKWDDWFRYELHQKLDQFDADLVVYDGNHAFPGLIDAVNAHGRARLVWMRRGMWGGTASPYIENGRFAELIIEPGEIAHSADVGLTATRRDETSPVGPITLLDKSELLPAEKAKEALCLPADAPAVLLQLGGGANRDVLALVDKIVHELKSFPDLQIVMAEWGNGLYDLPLWENTRILRGFPISKYFNAFDFSIAAAGYNTFHEVLEFQLPTIFIPNRDPSMDDQGGRADFAQDQGAGFVLAEDQMFHLKALCDALLNEAARNVVRQNCQNLSQPNGASGAAQLIAEVCA